MTEFEKAVIKEGRRIREMLKECEDISSFHFEVAISGRVLDGDLHITFGCGNYSATVRGNSVDSAVREYMRRQGWEHRNTGLCLPNVEEA